MSLNQLCTLILAVETVVTAKANLATLHATFDFLWITLIAFFWPVASRAHRRCCVV